jgi:hypothetical protein
MEGVDSILGVRVTLHLCNHFLLSIMITLNKERLGGLYHNIVKYLR